MKKQIKDTWTFEFRPDQVQMLRLILLHALKDVNSFNKDWLPSRIADRAILEIIEQINDVTG